MSDGEIVGIFLAAVFVLLVFGQCTGWCLCHKLWVGLRKSIKWCKRNTSSLCTKDLEYEYECDAPNQLSLPTTSHRTEILPEERRVGREVHWVHRALAPEPGTVIGVLSTTAEQQEQDRREHEAPEEQTMTVPDSLPSYEQALFM